jgi:hypothetical protein
LSERSAANSADPAVIACVLVRRGCLSRAVLAGRLLAIFRTLRIAQMGPELISACDSVVTETDHRLHGGAVAPGLGTTKDARKIGRKLFPVHRKAAVWPSAASKV